MKSRSEIESIIASAVRTKKLVISYPKPEEPLYKLTVKSSDPVKYGPKPSDIKLIGCKNDCLVTVVEYLNFNALSARRYCQQFVS